MTCRPIWASVVVLMLTLAACVQPGTPPASEGPSATQGSAPKRVVATVMTNPTAVFTQADDGSRPGTDVLQALIHASLSVEDNRGRLIPRLAEQVPSVENGLWKLLADGRMETTWRIREGAVWQDGAPVTSDDLVFAATVGQDREVPRFVNANFRFVDGLEALDTRTVTVRWKQPFIDADTLFGPSFASPIPRHLLENEYQQNKAGWENLAFWSSGAIGAGPFRLKQWEPGSHLILEAFDQYVIGRPRIDVLEVRFIPDGNTIVANVLAGAVEMTLGRSISVEQAGQLDRWSEGSVVVAPLNLIRLWWQFLNPDPPLIHDVRFRRALLRAVDREEMAEALQRNYAPAAYSLVYPGAFPEIEARLPRYEYDPRQSLAEIQALGYAAGADGLFRDGSGKSLGLDLMAQATQEVNVRAATAVVDYWKKVGVDATLSIEPTQITGLEKLRYEAERPGFVLRRSGPLPDAIPNLHSSRAALPTNGYNGTLSRYASPQLDALVDRYVMTIPTQERLAILGHIVQHMSAEVVLLPLIYGAEPAVMGSRLVNVGARPTGGLGGNPGWNAHDWDVR